MSEVKLKDAVAKVMGLSTPDLAWVHNRIKGMKPPKGLKREDLLAAVMGAVQENSTGDGEASVLNEKAEAALAGVGDGRPAAKAKPEKEPNVAVELGKLAKLPTGALREKYEHLYGKKVATGNRQFLLKKIAWKLQADAHGGLSDAAKARAEEIVEIGGVGTKLAKKLKEARPRDPRLPAPGSIITKTWREKELQVLVGENDFEYEGQKYRSLSAIASKLLNCAANGLLFFSLTDGAKAAAAKREAKKAAKDEAATTATPEAPAPTDATATPAEKKPAKKSKATKAKPAKRGAK